MVKNMKPMSSDHSYARINVVVLGRSLDENLTDSVLVEEGGAIKYRDAFQLKLQSGEAWLFDYGILVCWNVNESDRQKLSADISNLIIDSIEGQASEQFSFEVDAEKEFRIHNDLVVLPNDNKMIRLALSHAFAQSSKLAFFEDKAQKVIQKNSNLSKLLASTGKIPLSKLNLAKLRGVLFDTSSDISLHFNLLDTPEFFWNYPELEAYYLPLSKYLDLQPRIQILNQKLSTIHELLNMLAAEQHHKHAAFLEWIIIVLIAIDILVYFFPK
ncbi:MAG: putative Rmd1/YagE family protein [Candidatus Endobugula sp.]|jgi:uncharacterized Rmd1/YagE family protein